MSDDNTDSRQGEPRYLGYDELVAINERVASTFTPDEPRGVHQAGSLEAAQNRPAFQHYYAGNHDLIALAAVLFEGVALKHPFLSANKRTAFAACRVFLLLNGARFDPPTDETIEVTLGLVDGTYSLAQVAYWISLYTEVVEPSPLADAIEAGIPPENGPS